MICKYAKEMGNSKGDFVDNGIRIVNGKNWVANVRGDGQRKAPSGRRGERLSVDKFHY